MVGGGRLLRGLGHLAGAVEAAIGRPCGSPACSLAVCMVTSRSMHAFDITFVHVPVSRRYTFWI
jgi:hypothetical protein